MRPVQLPGARQVWNTSNYGFSTVIIVPLLSPSGSWLAVAMYVWDARVAFVIVKVTLLMPRPRLVFVMVQTPFALVVQLVVPVKP